MGYAIGAGVLIGLSILMFLVYSWAASGRLARNPILGLRSAATRKSDNAWVEAHHAALVASAPYLIAAVLCGVASLVQVGDPSSAAFAMWLGVIVFALGFTVSTIKGFRAANTAD